MQIEMAALHLHDGLTMIIIYSQQEEGGGGLFQMRNNYYLDKHECREASVNFTDASRHAYVCQAQISLVDGRPLISSVGLMD